MRSIAIAVLLASVAPFITPPPARACGGFFCNASTPVPIVQAGERVLFAPHDGLVTMHIEIVYQGDPTQFGWILPVAELPMGTNGQPLPLDEAVEVSSQALFPLLQARTDPQFVLNRAAGDGAVCSGPEGNGGFFDSSVQDTTASADAGVQPPVVVLQEAAVGPYDAQLIEAQSSDALYLWLADNGYLQDPNAQPILDHYVSKGFKFIGIKLQSGKTTGDLRPLAITLGEDAPCVPLVLTQIAATPDMPILVWVLGNARAVPKNFIHAQIDERALTWPGAFDYQSALTRALDEAGRRAWVTEFAGSTEPFRGSLFPAGTSTDALHRATHLEALLVALGNLGIATNDPDLQAVLRERVPRPEGLRGYPFGNCMQCQSCSWAEDSCAQQGLPNDSHETTDAELYGFISYWAGLDAAGTIDLGVDVAALADALEREVIASRRSLEALFADATTLTRFFTLISPDEMSRDPIFAFNADLPDVSNVHTATWSLVDCESNRGRITYPDGTTLTADCGGSCRFGFAQFQPVQGVSPLLYPEVLDESGDPIRFAKSQVEEVDYLLQGAYPGSPSLPATFDAHEPNVPSFPRDEGGGAKDDGGCAGGGASVFGALWLLGHTIVSHGRLSSRACSSSSSSRRKRSFKSRR